MKPHLIPTDKLRAFEKMADETLAEGAAAAQDAIVAARRIPAKERWLALDRMLAAAGQEISSLLIIALALAILCAPIGLGLAATYFLSMWAVRATGHPLAGWIVGGLVFAFLCRYVWGIRLQRASRRAAEALIASKIA